ncbi:MAG: hypothetical protein ACI89X_003820 [Planctomycetota bacterium]|jgi:hypothetical protein
MSNPTAQHSADERLLDAALAQVYGGDDAVVLAAGPAARRVPWLQAAVFLLGIGITVLVFLGGGTGDLVSAQDPVPFGVALRAEGRAEVEALPDDITNLTCRLLKTEDLRLLERFRSLRRLQIGALNVKIAGYEFISKHTLWPNAPAEVFAPLASLPALESLTLPMHVKLTGKHLTPLRTCASLRELSVMGGHIPLTEEFVAALDQLPHLRSLQLDLVPCDAAVVRTLRKLGLEGLSLSRCQGFEGEAFAELCAMSTLRRLTLHRFGTRQLGQEGKGNYWMPSAADLSQLKSLESLQHMKFQSTSIGGDELKALPDDLLSLELWATELLPADYLELRRFASLQRLRVRTARQTFTFGSRDTIEQSESAANAIADAIATLPLLELDFTGSVTQPLMRQLGVQPNLCKLRLSAHRIPFLDELATAPVLHALQLFQNSWPSQLSLDQLRALTKCQALAELEVGGQFAFSKQDVVTLFGERVTVTYHVYGK